MSILDTFYILFKTNAEKAAEDVEGVGDAADDAADKLKKTEQAADNVGSSFVTMAKRMAAPLLAMASIGGTFAAVQGLTNHIRELDAVAAKTNSAIGDVDAFRRAVMAAGGDGGAALGSLEVMAEKVNEAFSDAESEARKDFALWGVAIKDTEGSALGASDALLNLASSLEGVSRAEALARIKKLGIEDAASIELILRGRAALEEQMNAQKELGVATKESAEQARRYGEQVARVKAIALGWVDSILMKMIPALTFGAEMVEKFARWTVRNKDLVTGFFGAIAAIITGVYLPAMVRAAIATTVATWPFIALGAAIAAVAAGIALAYEDIVAFMNGEPSLIGELAEKWEWFGDVIRGIAWVVRTVGQAFGWVWEKAQEFFSGIPEDLKEMGEGFARSAQAIKDALGGAFQWVKEQWDRWVAPIFDKIGAVMEFLRDGETPAELAQQGAGTVYDGSAGYNQPKALPTPNADARARMDALYDLANNSSLPAAQSALAAATSAPINGATTASIQNASRVENSNNTTSVKIGDINVTTAATDPRETGRAVRAEIERYLKDTSAQLDDGVRN